MKLPISCLSAGLILLGGAGCASTDQAGSDANAAQNSRTRPTAVAVITPAANGPVKGQVTFVEEAQGVRVTAHIEGLTPGKHGFHIHEKGDCSAADFTSAGGHFNPTASRHGSPSDSAHHVGDFGNIEANEKGVARLERSFSWLTFSGTNSILHKAVIIHEKADDLQTQPTGNAGGRIGCGVIMLTN